MKKSKVYNTKADARREARKIGGIVKNVDSGYIVEVDNVDTA